jgi:primosomal protein N' (replication factor Y)
MPSGGTPSEDVLGSDVFLDIIVDVPSLSDRRFTYRSPSGQELSYGAKVRVPFGKSQADGFVLSRVEKPEGIRVKDILFPYDLRFLPSREMLDFCRELAAYYCVSLASMWSCLWPPVVPRMKNDPPRAGDVTPTTYREGDPKGQCPDELVWGSLEYRWDRYTAMVKEGLLRGKGSLVLVPESKEMAYAVSRLREVAGDLVYQVSSEMTGLSRREGWLLAKASETPVVVGTRSAVFADVRKLGLIVFDEDWSDSYKSPETPLYDARTVARLRGRRQGARVLFGSSHPSLWAVNLAREGLIEVSREDVEFGPVQIVDLKEGGPRRQAVSPVLQERMRVAFHEGKRVFLFLNKRGDASQVVCQDCGNTIKCPSCGSPLVYHSKDSSLVCHTCDYHMVSPERCPACGGTRWRFLGFGIEKAASEFLRHFPDVPLYRLDKDSLDSGSVEDTLRRFGLSGPSCLLGTQLALGQPGFPPVGLVGVLSGDTILNLPGFRASERVFHTFWRLRDLCLSSEDLLPPEMVAQTYNPEHHAVRGLCDPDGFYEEELSLRRSVGYPPFAALFKVRFAGKNLDKVRALAQEFAKACAKKDLGIRVLGPIPSPKPKVRNQFHWQVALRHREHSVLTSACDSALKELQPSSQVKVSIDVEPVDMR